MLVVAALAVTPGLGACGDEGGGKRVGETCTEADECESGMCQQQICVNPVGAECSENAHCASGLCDLERLVCAQAAEDPTGELIPCDADTLCPSGMTCDLERQICMPAP